jgi:hypothetical protein
MTQQQQPVSSDEAVINALAIENANLKVRCIRLEHALAQQQEGVETPSA